MKHGVLMCLGLLYFSRDLAMCQSSTNTKNGGLTFSVKKPETTVDCSDEAKLPSLSTTAPNIIHYVKWTDKKEYTDRWIVQGPKASTSSSKRIFGASEIRVLAVHDNIEETTEVNYKVDIKKKSPSWMQNLTTLLGLGTSKASTRVCKIGYIDLKEVPVPSDITVSAAKSSSEGTDPTAPIPVPSGATEAEFTETFDNESKYWADFSFGLPILNKKLTDFEISDGVLQRKEGSRAAAHGFVNLYLIGGPRDTKKRGIHPPHLMIGLPLNGRALDNPVAAMGFTIAQAGIQFDIYAGCSFNRTEVLKSGLPGTDPRWVRKLAIGLNIPVGQFVSAYLKKK